MADLSHLSTEQLIKMRDSAASTPKPQDLSTIPTEDLLKMRNQAQVSSAQTKQYSPLETGARSFFQGVTASHMDELVGGLEAIGHEIGIRGLGGSLSDIRRETPEESKQSFGDVYTQRRDLRRAQDTTAEIQNPKSAIFGNLAGSATLMSALPLAGSSSLKAAGIVGAIGGEGASKGDIGSGEYFGDVLKGGGEGLAFGVLGKGLEKVSSKVIQSFANSKAVKASGFMTKEFREMPEEQQQAFGRQLLENKIVGFWDNLNDIAKNARKSREASGKIIGGVLDKVDDLASSAKEMVDSGAFGKLNDVSKNQLKDQIDKEFQFSMQRVASRIQDELVNANPGNPVIGKELKMLQGLADDFSDLGSQNLQKGQQIKTSMRLKTKFASETIPERFKQEVYGIISSELERPIGNMGYLEAAIERANGNTIGNMNDPAEAGKQILAQFQKANSDYRVAAEAGKAAQKRLGQVKTNRPLGLYDVMTGLTTGAVSSLASGHITPEAIITGLASAGLVKVAKTYGNSTIASSANNIAKLMAASPKALGDFRQILENAAKNGSLALTTTHMQLLQNPDYQKLAGIGDNNGKP